ncbi:V-type ATP synthase subunit E, partial [archaeon]|nr:V-type ATP synthase subunit E [archaeon]
GGIIAENSDGDIQVDYSYDALLEEAFSDNVSEIRKKLLN